MTDNTDQRWLTIFACQCPNCGHPRVEHVLPAFLPSPEYIKELKLGMLPCERCHFRWQPLAHECCLNVLAVNLKKDFQIHTPDK